MLSVMTHPLQKYYSGVAFDCIPLIVLMLCAGSLLRVSMTFFEVSLGFLLARPASITHFRAVRSSRKKCKIGNFLIILLKHVREGWVTKDGVAGSILFSFPPSD
jgi:hypothetical protein